MNTVVFLLQGFGFKSLLDFKQSTFGYMMNAKILSIATLLASVSIFVEDVFGFDVYVLMACTVFIGFEWVTGVAASFHRGEKHESRKLGRMFLKMSVYMVPVYVFNTLKNHIDLPLLESFGFNPFSWVHTTILLVIIWQLLVSVLENASCLGFAWATVLLKIINKKFYQKLELDEEGNSTE